MQEDNHVFQGLRRDNHQIRQDAKFLWDAKNIRLTNRDDDTFLSITNEKGTSDPLIELKGKYVGHCTINDYLVLFLHDDNVDAAKLDSIYRLNIDNGELKYVQLFVGNINLSPEHPIEALGVYENDGIQKIYWTDGKNVPRVINIIPTNNNYNSTSFDFISSFTGGYMEVTKEYTGGLFPCGTILYVFTYYNKYLLLTNIVNNSSILYLDNNGNGGSPDNTCLCTFNLKLSNLDKSYDYVRIYSIIRTTINSEPTVKRVVDIPITSDSVVFTDTGTIGDVEDPTILLYLQSALFKCNTIAALDGTLFFGGISSEGLEISTEAKEYIAEHSTVEFEQKTISGNVSSYNGYNGLLSQSLDKISTFKYGEIYRVGVQFQTALGDFSEPIYLGDVANNIKPYVISGAKKDSINLSQLTCNLKLPEQFPSKYIRARLVIVEPSVNNRSVLCQGIVCPTVFNVGSRMRNRPYVLASWTLRLPNAHYSVLPHNIEKNAEILCTQIVNEDLFSPSLLSLGFTTLKYYFLEVNNDNTHLVNYFYQIGDNDEVQHSHLIYGSFTLEAAKNLAYYLAVSELALMFNSNYIPSQEEWESYKEDSPGIRKVLYIPVSSDNRALLQRDAAFCSDSSIVTLFSPDILDESNYLDSSLKFRIIGYFELDSANRLAAWELFSKTPALVGGGEINSTFNLLYSAPLWESISVSDSKLYNFITYMWHGPTLSDTQNTNDGSARASLLEKKTFSNIRWATEAKYLNTAWTPKGGTNSIVPFNSEELKIVSILNGSGDLCYYMGNIDTVITAPYSIAVLSDLSGGKKILESTERTEPIRISYKTTPHSVISFKKIDTGRLVILPSNTGFRVTNYGLPVWEYPAPDVILIKAIVEEDNDKNNILDLVTDDLVYVKNKLGLLKKTESSWVSVFIADRSFLLCDNVYYSYTILYLDSETPYSSLINKAEVRPIDQDIILRNNSGDIVYIGELYKDIEASTLYGDPSIPSVLQSHSWIPAGELELISNNQASLIGNTGDTYYQRWDCLMSYPYTQESINKVIDITSFMVESRTNLDGRYDKKRGNFNDLTIVPLNFNLINQVYSQKDNFFNYRILDLDYNNLSTFQNQLVWSKLKLNAELVDSWTHTTQTSSLYLNGTKEKITALVSWNNYLLCLQEKAVSLILFNSRTLIPTTDGVPIEISNNYKVDGSRDFSTGIGCSNKWSVVTTPLGVYFIDSTTGSLYLFNGLITNISKDRGMDWWARKNADKIWKPYSTANSNGIRSFYDLKYGDVYFTPGEIGLPTQNDALCYSELLGQFTSFMSYGGTQAMFNFADGFYSLRQDGNVLKLYLNNVGLYNNFYGNPVGWRFSFISNLNPLITKVFDTIEMRADNYSVNGDTSTLTYTCPITEIQVTNEYLDTDVVQSNMKKKFRVWRGLIPRHEGTRQRIRNPWAKITLGWTPADSLVLNANNKRAIIHDVSVKYTV